MRRGRSHDGDALAVSTLAVSSRYYATMHSGRAQMGSILLHLDI